MDKIYNHKELEKKAQSFWEEKKVYSMENNPGELYSIDTPPPTVSGSLHIGHIFSYTQTDIIARYKRMSGYRVFYPFGFDDNGLPTERFVEKKRKISAISMSRSEFINICLEETQQVENQFKELWKKVGLSADWSKCYSTISDNTRKISQESFIILLKKGYIYRKKEPALYCTTCFTSVAQAELDDKEVSSTFSDIIFFSDKNEKLIIGTTRPELVSSVVALLYHPEDAKYKHLKGTIAIVPIYGYEVPILEDELVDPNKGTGLVMVSTFGDKNDITWYKKFNLPYIQSVGLNGKWTKISGPLEGLKVHEARKKILELLKEQGLLVSQKPITHSVNVHERCKNEIEYIELPQWFIKIVEFKDKFLKMADKINWYPAFMKSRYVNWVQNISWDWCISRQRFYGIPFPVWHCQDCNEMLIADINDLPIDPRETKFRGEVCGKCNGKNIVPDTDVMDTWNTSSLTPQICYSLLNDEQYSPFGDNIKTFIPMSMRPQAHDIIRTWAFYTIVKSWMHYNVIPWKDIIISGHVLSSAKEKISKSKENESTTPDNLLSRYSADAIRFWTASGTLGQDIYFSEAQLQIGQKLINKLWNAFRFCNEHLENAEFNKPGSFDLVNEWILTKSTECFKDYKNYFDNNEFGLALDTVEKFFWKSFCDNYLELIKDQLFNPANYKAENINCTKWTLYQVGLCILQLYAPYLPHVTENIYETLYKKSLNIDSIHQTKFSLIQHQYDFKLNAQYMENIIDLIGKIRKLKTENKLSLKSEIENLTVFSLDQNLIKVVKENERLIKGITHSKNIAYESAPLPAETLSEVNGVWQAKVLL